MKWQLRLRQAAIALAAVGTLLPQTLLAASPAEGALTSRPAAAPLTPDAPQIVDVALADGGLLAGQVVDAQGAALAGVTVTVSRQQQIFATTLTDSDGQFSVHSLQGGVYQISALTGVALYRVWAPQTAPPAAGKRVLVVAAIPLVRGNNGGPRPISYWLTSPWVLAGLLGAAIIVPIAVGNTAKPSSS